MLHFRYDVLFQNDDDSKATAVQNRRQISHFTPPPVITEGEMDEMSESVFDKFSLDPTSHVLLAGAAVRAERSNQNFNLNTICEQFAILNLIRSGFQPIGDLQGPKVHRYTKV